MLQELPITELSGGQSSFSGGGDDEVKRTVVKFVIAFAAACLLNRAYNTFGWHFFKMPYPDIIAPIFNMWAGAHYDAVEMEWLVEFFLVALAIIFAGDWIVRRANSN